MVNWSEIDTVLLDMDGTLLDLYFDNFFWLEHLPRRYSEMSGRELEVVRAELKLLSDSLHGHLNWYCVDHWSECLALDVVQLKHEVSHLICMRADALAFLAFLREEGKRAVLVTNAHPSAMMLKLEMSGLGTHIDIRYSSHPFGLAKENAGFWELLRAAGDFDYQRCLFIDDSPSVLRRAREEGLPHLLQVLQPDSSQPARIADEFPGFTLFSELMPT